MLLEDVRIQIAPVSSIFKRRGSPGNNKIKYLIMKTESYRLLLGRIRLLS